MPRSRRGFATPPETTSSSSTATGSIAPRTRSGWSAALANTISLVVGARSSDTQATRSRHLGNSALNALASYLSDYNIPDLTSGFRAARRDALTDFIYLLPNGFSTPTTTTLAFLKAGYSVVFEPTSARPRVGTSKIRFVRDGTKFMFIVLPGRHDFQPAAGLRPISLAALALGGGYGAWTIATQSHVTNSSVLLIVLRVVVFLLGLISEQIFTLRFVGHRR